MTTERTKQQKRIAELLFSLWAAYPEMRLGQLIDNARFLVKSGDLDAYYVTDDEWETALKAIARKGFNVTEDE